MVKLKDGIDYSQFEKVSVLTGGQSPQPTPAPDAGIDTQAQPAVEPKVEPSETPTPEPVKTVDKPTDVPTTPPTPTETLNYEFFNKTFKTDFKTEDELRSALESASKAKQLETQLQDYENLKATLEDYKKSVDPLSYFASEDDYRVQQFKKTNPDKNASVVSKLFTSDLGKLSDLDVLTQFELLDGTIGNEAEAATLLAEKYGIDAESDPSEWTVLAKTRLKRDANQARAEIKAMKDGVKLPERVDVESNRKLTQEEQQRKAEALQKGWNDIVPKMLTNLKEIEINDYDKDGKSEPVFKYAIAEDDKPQLQKDILDYLVSNNKEVNEVNVQEAGNVVQGWYVLRNVAKMMKAMKAEIAAAIDAQKDAEVHNPNPIKSDTRPPDDAETKRKQDLIDYSLGGSQFKRNVPSWRRAKT